MSDMFGSDGEGEGWDEEDDDLGVELSESARVSCPYCGEEVEVHVDPAGGGLQEYVEDCQVCCRPWSVRVSVGRDGAPDVRLTTLDDL